MKEYRKYDDVSLKKLKMELLEIFKVFDKLCRKYEINYFATAGTLLGAIRHGGFIPWDDDLDIGMLRADYEKFLKIPREEFEGYGLCAPEITPGEYYSFVTKFYKKGTKFITPISYVDNKMNMGIFIELFPFDDVEDKNANLEKQIKKVNRIKNFYTTAACDNIIVFDSGIKGSIKKLIKRIVKMYLRITRNDLNKLTSDYIKTINVNLNSEMAYAFSDVGHLIKKAGVESTEYRKFEDTQILVPKDYDMVLKGLYGSNYMQLPPEEKRWNQAPIYIQFSDGSCADFSE